MTELDRLKLEAALRLPGATASLIGDAFHWWANAFWAVGEAVDHWIERETGGDGS